MQLADIQDVIQMIQAYPWLGALIVILTSYLLEDLAIVSGAVAAAEGILSLPVALFAVFVGIATGDLGLYLLGLAARRWRGLRAKLLLNPYSRKIRRQLRTRTIINIFIIRFIPGLRTIGFTLCGMYRVSVAKFSFAVTLATSLWTFVVFTSIYQLGVSMWLQESQNTWWLIPIAFVVLYIGNKSVKRSIFKEARP